VTRVAPASTRVERLLHDHADWAPYVAALRDVARALDDGPTAERKHAPRALACTIDGDGSRREDANSTPLLHDAVIEVDARALDAWMRRLLRLAAEHGGAATLGDAPRARGLDARALVEAAIDHDAERLATLAGDVGVDASALGAIAHLAAAPLLHDARRAHESARPEPWDAGHCPVCGAFPTLAEARGLEGTRRLRCVRCGSDWWTEWLRCSYCDNRDHETLGALVPDEGGETRRAETCDQCHGYLKMLTTLIAIPSAELGFEDLASIDLDLAAIARGYRRPSTSGVRLDARVVAVDRPTTLLDHVTGLFRS
jgi:FdhE protein